LIHVRKAHVVQMRLQFELWFYCPEQNERFSDNNDRQRGDAEEQRRSELKKSQRWRKESWVHRTIQSRVEFSFDGAGLWGD
jgi:hypothetical protein